VELQLHAFLNVALWVSDHLHAAAALTPGKGPPVSIGYKAGWALEPVWTR